MVKNIKIKTFLIASFSWILLLMIGLGAASTYFTRRLATQTITFYESPHTIQLEVANVRNCIGDISSAIKEAMVYQTPEQTEKTTAAVSKYMDEMNGHIKLVSSLFTSDKNLLINADNAVAAWTAEIEKLRVLMEDKEYVEAIRLFETSYLDSEKALENSVIQISDISSQETLSYYESAKRSKSISVMVITVVVLISVLSTIMACTSILRSITVPLKKVRDAADAMAHGDLKHLVEFEGSNEFGELAKSIDITVRTLSEYVSDISHVLNQLSNNNMTVRVERDYIGDLAPIKVSMEKIILTLNNALLEISQSSELVASGATQVASSSQVISQGASEQAASAQELSSSMDSISAQVRESADFTEQANELAEQVGSKLEYGNQQMQDMLKAMSQINDASNQIAKIIKTIEDIAFQTNILALNAAVEAARAGAAGKGFAVVADEVRNLAGKSAEAAKSTTALIQNTIMAVDNGTKIADSTAQTLDSVVSGARDITAMVSKLAETAEKQAASLEQVSSALDQITQVVQSNSATSEECAAASEEMSSQAQTMKILVGRYKLREQNQPTTMNYRSSQNDKYGSS